MTRPSDNDPCLVDLGKMDLYPDNIVPDGDVETCLKVLRTIRSMCLTPPTFDAHGAVLMSHAHACIHDKVKQVQEAEQREREETSAKGGTTSAGDGQARSSAATQADGAGPRPDCVGG